MDSGETRQGRQLSTADKAAYSTLIAREIEFFLLEDASRREGRKVRIGLGMKFSVTVERLLPK